jgi:hypothetical protein
MIKYIRKEHRLRVFENRGLRKIFQPKSEEVFGDRRKLHNEGLHDLCLSQVIIWCSDNEIK